MCRKKSIKKNTEDEDDFHQTPSVKSGGANECLTFNYTSIEYVQYIGFMLYPLKTIRK